MKKILYVCPTSGIGGAETFLLQTLSHGNIEEFENHYLLFRSGPLNDKLQELGARVHILNTPPKLSKRSDRKQVHNKIKDLINGYNIDLVHSTMAYGALFAARTCKTMKVPHVWFQHGPASGWMDRAAAVLPHDGLIVNSHFTGKTQRKLENPVRFLIPRENPIEKILLGTPEVEWPSDQVQAEKAKLIKGLGLANDKVTVGMLCRIQKWKGLHLVLEALESMKPETLNKIQIIIWGEAFKGKEYLNQLTSRVKSSSLPVVFAGATSNSSLSLACCESVVNASIQPEPFGLSIIEGMMVGAVPIAPNEGGPLEVVHNGENGLLFKARQAKSLAGQFERLVVDDKLRQQLSKSAKEEARQKYNSKRAIAHLEKFHSKLMG